VAALTRADYITQATRTIETYSDFTDNFTKNPVTNQLVLLKNQDSIKQGLMNLILTNPGERLFNPYYGSGVTGSLFENFTPFTVEDITSNIINSARSFEPRVTIQNLQIIATDDDDAMSVTITFSIVNIAAPVTMNLFIQRVR